MGAWARRAHQPPRPPAQHPLRSAWSRWMRRSTLGVSGHTGPGHAGAETGGATTRGCRRQGAAWRAVTWAGVLPPRARRPWRAGGRDIIRAEVCCGAWRVSPTSQLAAESAASRNTAAKYSNAIVFHRASLPSIAQIRAQISLDDRHAPSSQRGGQGFVPSAPRRSARYSRRPGD